jgi:hypothetical protein
MHELLLLNCRSLAQSLSHDISPTEPKVFFELEPCDNRTQRLSI